MYSANEFLTRVNLMKAYQPGSETPIMRPTASPSSVAATSRWTRHAAPSVSARPRCISFTAAARTSCLRAREEVEHAKEEGIEFRLLTNPIEILRGENGFVAGIRCERMELASRTRRADAARSP